MKFAKLFIFGLIFVFLVSVVYAQNLTISKVEIKIDGDKETVSEEETIDNVKPGSNIDIKVHLENLFTDDENGKDIEDIEVVVTVFGIEDEGDDDVELSDDIERIRPERDKSTTWLSFDVPLKVEATTYDVEIEVTYDEEGGESSLELDPYRFELEVEKKSHEIIISKAELSKNNLECIKQTTLNVEMMNLGENDEDEAVLEITSDDLGINVKEMVELLEDPFDDENTYSKTVAIDAEELKQGTYPIVIRAYRDTDKLQQTKNIDLVVLECVEKEKEEEPIVVAVCGNNIVETGEECDDGNAVSGDGCSVLCKIEVPTTPTGYVPVEFEETFWEQYGTTVMIIAGELIFLFVILIIVAVALRRK